MTLAKIAALSVLVAGVAAAGEKNLVHCFYFTPVKAATDADWQAFFKSTDGLPEKIPGLVRVSYGKLTSPRRFLQFAGEGAADAGKKLRASGGTITAEVKEVTREWGACMVFENEQALKTYAGHPAHKEWEEVYSKVREYGTTTFDFMGQ